MTVQVSVLMPAYNEAENLVEVVPHTLAVLQRLGLTHEVLVVDDGSHDGTPAAMSALQDTHPHLRYVRLRRNMGKSAALSTGFSQVTGDVVILMDADGQDDPTEIPKLLDALENGLDQVTGSRTLGRHDRFVKRTTSKLYNGATRVVTGVAGRDFNSGFKAMRREVAENLDMYGELHRYIPVMAAWAGFRVGEVPVQHHERRHGRSKFGSARFWRGFLDLITIKFLTTYTRRPFHLFGGLGLTIGAVGSGLLAWMAVEKVLGNAIGNRPALTIGVLLTVVGVQLMSLGLLGELIIQRSGSDEPQALARERYTTGVSSSAEALPSFEPAPLRPPDPERVTEPGP